MNIQHEINRLQAQIDHLEAYLEGGDSTGVDQDHMNSFIDQILYLKLKQIKPKLSLDVWLNTDISERQATAEAAIKDQS